MPKNYRGSAKNFAVQAMAAAKSSSMGGGMHDSINLQHNTIMYFREEYIQIILEEIGLRFTQPTQDHHNDVILYGTVAEGLLEVKSTDPNSTMDINLDWLVKILTDWEIPFDMKAQWPFTPAGMNNNATSYYRPNDKCEITTIKEEDHFLPVELLEHHVNHPELLKDIINTAYDKIRPPEKLLDIPFSGEQKARMISLKFTMPKPDMKKEFAFSTSGTSRMSSSMPNYQNIVKKVAKGLSDKIDAEVLKKYIDGEW